MSDELTASQALAFFRSAILSGERWTDSCERIYIAALEQLIDVADAAPAVPGATAPVAWAIKCINPAPPIYEVMVGDYCYITFKDEQSARVYHKSIYHYDKFAVVPLYAAPPVNAGESSNA